MIKEKTFLELKDLNRFVETGVEFDDQKPVYRWAGVHIYNIQIWKSGMSKMYHLFYKELEYDYNGM